MAAKKIKAYKVAAKVPGTFSREDGSTAVFQRVGTVVTDNDEAVARALALYPESFTEA